MYLDHFELTEHPFQLTPDSHFLYLSAHHMRAKAYMDYTVWRRDGFVVITGEVGAGKTTLIHKLLSEVDGNVELIRIFQTQLNEIEFLQTILVEIGFEPDQIKQMSKVELLNQLNVYLLDTYSKGKHVVLIVDEAQNLSPKVLEEIRLLSGLEPDKEKILNIILVGQPQLNDTLSRPDLEQLVQRIRLRFHVGALSEEDTARYIEHRLHVAGAKRNLFDSLTIPTIQEYTGGIPRRINILCDTALICAFADGVDMVTPEILKEAIDELQWTPARPKKERQTKSGDNAQTTHNGIAESAQDLQAAALQAPSFAGGNDQWANLFSLTLKLMSDMSSRMERIDARLEALESMMQQRGATGLRPNRPDDSERVSRNTEADITVAQLDSVNVARNK